MKLLKRQPLNKEHPFVIVAEAKGFWFWKKDWAIYREWSYTHGGKDYRGRDLKSRHTTLGDAITTYNRLLEAFYAKA